MMSWCGNRRVPVVLLAVLFLYVGIAAGDEQVQGTEAGARSPFEVTPYGNADGKLAPAFFGPVIEPDRIIKGPAGLRSSSIYPARAVDIDGDTAFITGEITKQNVWGTIVWFWPEVALLTCLFILAFLLWRLRVAVKRPQIKGQPHCRKCNYCLAGSTAKTCPECGVQLTARNRVISRGRSAKRCVVGLVIVLVVGGYLGFRWYPPHTNFMGYGASSDLPRTGAVSDWFDWYSHDLYHTSIENEWNLGIDWTHHGATDFGQMWRVDLHTGAVAELMIDYKVREPGNHWPGPLRKNETETSAPMIYRADHLHILSTGVERHLFDAERGIYATLPTGWWFSEFGEPTDGLLWSNDGSYLFDTMTFTVPAVWDTTTWKNPKLFPGKLYGKNESHETVRLRSIRFVPDPAKVVIEAYPESLATSKLRLILWDSQTGTTRELPAKLGDFGVHVIATTDDERFVVAEQWNPDGPYPIVLDTKNTPTENDDVNMHVPLEELNTQDTLQLAAVARRGHVIYVYAERYFAWHLSTGEVKPLTAPPLNKDVHWISKPETRKRRITAIARKNSIEIDDQTGQTIETIHTPLSVHDAMYTVMLTIAGDNDRFVCGQVNSTIVLYDRQRKQWLGRFHVATTAPDWLDQVLIDDKAERLVGVVESDERVKLHVFELKRFK